MMEQDIEHGINVVRHKYSNDPNFKGKPLFLKFCKKISRSRHSISSCPDKRYTNSLEKPSFQYQTLNQAMKGNQNLPNKQVKSNNMKGKPLPFSHRSRSNSRKHRNNSKHRNPNKFSQTGSKQYYGNSNFKPPSRSVSPYPRPSNSENNSNYNSRPRSPYYKRDGVRPPRGLFFRNRIRNIRKYINSFLDQAQTDDTIKKIRKQKTSPESKF